MVVFRIFFSVYPTASNLQIAYASIGLRENSTGNPNMFMGKTRKNHGFGSRVSLKTKRPLRLKDITSSSSKPPRTPNSSLGNPWTQGKVWSEFHVGIYGQIIYHIPNLFLYDLMLLLVISCYILGRLDPEMFSVLHINISILGSNHLWEYATTLSQMWSKIQI